MSWTVHYKPSARGALTEILPEAVALASVELIEGDLSREPYRVGKSLEDPLEGLHSARRGTYRIIYKIVPGKHVIDIVSIKHRRDAYRY